MDNRTSRLNRGEAVKRRREQTIHYGRQLWQSLQKQKSLCLTGILFIALIVLLFCLASQLPAPATDVAANGAATIDYSTFVQQVNANNVLAVAFQGDDMNGLLATPLVHNNSTIVHPPVHTDVAKSADYAAWISSLGISTFPHSNGPDPSSLNPSLIVSVHVPAGSSSLLMQSLENKHVLIQVIAASRAAAWLILLGRFVPILLLVVIVFVFIFGRNRQQGMARSMDQRVSQLGKSRVRRFERSKEVSASQKRSIPRIPGKAIATGRSTSVQVSPVPSVTFADVAGIDEVRAELSEIVQFLRSPQLFNRLGARIPRGALLVGPPGTGKTLLARAVAGEAQVPFFSMSASEFVEMFVGVGASRVRDLFNQARQVSPCVIFIDELDAVGRKRSVRANGNDERDQTLNQLLVELDGFDERQAVVVLAATNRADILDKALLRPGRFDRCITVSLPDRIGRTAILKVHTRNTPLSEDVSLERLARMTTGMTGADLANLVNEAALLAARQELEAVNHECFEDALARVQLGALRPLVMGEDERRIIAVHEGGHALVAYHLPEADTVNRVTILPRGQSLGVTQFTAEVDRYNYRRSVLMARIAVGLGGRVAEEITFGLDQITTGAENDLQVVTDLARRMVTRWGMSEHVGVVFADYQPGSDYALTIQRLDPETLPARSLVADTNGNLFLNGMRETPTPQSFAMSTPAPRTTSTGIVMNVLIDSEIQRILNEGRAIARTILTNHRDQLILLADTLILHEQLDRGQFEALLQE